MTAAAETRITMPSVMPTGRRKPWRLTGFRHVGSQLRRNESLGHERRAALLRVTAAFEAATAVGLLVLPALVLTLLFGPTPDRALYLLLAGLGAPLLSLSVMCWAASAEPRGRAILPHVPALLLYNVIVAALLLCDGDPSAGGRRSLAGGGRACVAGGLVRRGIAARGQAGRGKRCGAGSMNAASFARSRRLPRNAVLCEASNNGLAHKHFLYYKWGRMAEHRGIECCKAHPDEKISRAIRVVFKDMRAEMSVNMR
jgi:hypothetical protein